MTLQEIFDKSVSLTLAQGKKSQKLNMSSGLLQCKYRGGQPVLRVEIRPGDESVLHVLTEGMRRCVSSILFRNGRMVNDSQEHPNDLIHRKTPLPPAAPEVTVHAGLTLREELAKEAMKILMSCITEQQLDAAKRGGLGETLPEVVANMSVMQADALIAALNKPASGPIGEPAVEDDVHPPEVHVSTASGEAKVDPDHDYRNC